MTSLRDRRDAWTDVGPRVRHLREECGLAREALAQRVGVTGHTIRHVEESIRPPSVALLRALAAEFGCTVSHLLGERTPLPAPNVPAPPLTVALSATAHPEVPR